MIRIRSPLLFINFKVSLRFNHLVNLKINTILGVLILLKVNINECLFEKLFKFCLNLIF